MKFKFLEIKRACTPKSIDFDQQYCNFLSFISIWNTKTFARLTTSMILTIKTTKNGMWRPSR